MRFRSLLFISIFIASASNGQNVRLEDRSDWWSLYSEREPGLKVKLTEKHFDTRSFTIIGVNLVTLDFKKVASRLGRATIVDRGDASYSRSQACYVSDGGSEKIHLIFESGEGGDTAFYLFRGGAGWKGMSYCVKSNQVSADLTTGSGLKLGLTRAEVEAILGKPEAAAADRIAYCREFKKKTTKQEFERLRNSDPRASDKMAHEQYDFIEESLWIEARFTEDGLSFLYVSTLEDTV
jgi:hypothetical protein